MALVEFTREENVAVLTMNGEENRFNFPFFQAFHEALDQVEQTDEASVLVATSIHPKIWSNGIDLDWFLPALTREGPDLRRRYLLEFTRLLRRVLLFPMITIAAISGHAFAGGAYLAFAFDFRFMRTDRGWLCLPEVDVGATPGPMLTALARKAVPLYKFEEMQYTGKRLGAQECLEHHIVSRTYHLEDLMPQTMTFALSLKKDRNVIAAMKAETYKDLIQTMDDFSRTLRESLTSAGKGGAGEG